MSRYSPQVLPRRKATLADALAEGAGAVAQGLHQREARQDRDRTMDLREEELGLRREDAEFRRRQLEQQTARQRAQDAAEGIMHDPDDTYGRTPAIDFQVPTGPGMAVAPQMHVEAGRRSDVRSLGGGFTLDPTLTREGRAQDMKARESERLAAALQAAGVDPGVARAGGALPSALPFLLPREAAPTIPDWQKQGYPSFAAWRADRMRQSGIDPSSGQRLAGAGRNGSGRTMEAEDPDFEPGLSALDASRVVGDYDKETDQVADLSKALFDSGMDDEAVAKADSLSGVVEQRLQNRPKVPDLMRPRMRGVRGGGSTFDPARRWEELVRGGMPKDKATAQVQREMGGGGR